MLIKRRFAVGSEILTLVYTLKHASALRRRLYLAAGKLLAFYKKARPGAKAAQAIEHPITKYKHITG
jgi:hypothetical protein